VALVSGGGTTAWAGEALSGHAEVEARGYLYAPQHPGQDSAPVSAALKLAPRAELDLPASTHLSVRPFARVDSMDPHRNALDLREAALRWRGDAWRVAAGMDTVFWGVSETQNLVNIVNQIDRMERPDDEARLGQLMARVDVDFGTSHWQTLLMSGFRQRRFPSEQGRLRLSVPIAASEARFGSDRGPWSPDAATRLQLRHGRVETALSYFLGTNRHPDLVPELQAMSVVLIPEYNLIHQAGWEFSYLQGFVQLKAEAIAQQRADLAFDPYFAWTAGPEATLGMVGDVEVGVVAEWLYDTRQDDAPTPYQNDVMVGLRGTGFDVGGTQVLAAVVKDLEDDSWLLQVEMGRRFGQHLRVGVEAWMFGSEGAGDLLTDLSRDDYLELNLGVFF